MKIVLLAQLLKIASLSFHRTEQTCDTAILKNNISVAVTDGSLILYCVYNEAQSVSLFIPVTSFLGVFFPSHLPYFNDVTGIKSNTKVLHTDWASVVRVILQYMQTDRQTHRHPVTFILKFDNYCAVYVFDF